MTGKISGGFDFHGQQMAKCIPPEVKVDPFVCGIPGGPGGDPPGGLGDIHTKKRQNAHLLKLKFQRVNVGFRQGGGSADSATAIAVITMMVEIPTVVMVAFKAKVKTTEKNKKSGN